MIIAAHSFARAGLIGNPSDGYFGKTISFSVRNFRATVRLWESPHFEILPTHGDLARFERHDPDVRLPDLIALGDLELALADHACDVELAACVERQIGQRVPGVVYWRGTIEPGQATDFVPLTDTTTVVVKLPCVSGDKYMSDPKPA